MRRAVLEILLIDLVLVVAGYLVVQDLQRRVAYASAEVNRCAGLCSYTPSFSYGFLTQTFTMSGASVQLSSPPTLDWVQLLAYAFVVLNGWLAYTLLKSRRAMPPVPAPEA